MVVARSWGWMVGDMGESCQKIQVSVKLVSFVNIMYIMMSIDNNTMLYI